MPGMKVTVDTAMRARDVSRPRPEHEALAEELHGAAEATLTGQPGNGKASPPGQPGREPPQHGARPQGQAAQQRRASQQGRAGQPGQPGQPTAPVPAGGQDENERAGTNPPAQTSDKTSARRRRRRR
jgi:hypothetical protein